MNSPTLFLRLALLAVAPFLVIRSELTAQSTPAVETEKKATAVLRQPELQPLVFIKIASIQAIQDMVNTNFSEYPELGKKLAQSLTMAGLVLGDPSLSTLVPDSDINFIVLNDLSRPEPFIIVIKLTPDSPIRESLKKQGLKLSEVGPFTYIGKNPEILKQSTLSKGVYAIALKKRATAIEIGTWPNRLAGQILQNKTLFAQSAAKDSEALRTPEAQANIEGFIDVLCSEMSTADSAMMGLDLSNGSIKLQSLITAKAETPLHRFLSQSVGGPVNGAQFLAQKGMISAVARIDPVASADYCQTSLQNFSKASTGKLQMLFQRMIETVQQGWKINDGSYAMTVEMQGKGEIPAATMAMVTKLDRAAYLRELEQFYTKDLNNFYQALGDLFKQAMVRTEFAVKKDAYSVQKTPVDIVDMTMVSDPAFAKRAEAEALMKSSEESGNTAEHDAAVKLKEELDAAGSQEQRIVQTMHYAIVDNLILGSPTREALQPIVRLVSEGKPAANSLADTMSLEPGVAMRFAVHLEELLLASANAMEKENPEQANKLRDAMADLQLDPITGLVTVGNGKAGAKLKIPLSAILKIIEKSKPAAAKPDESAPAQ
ncbi:MAG: hypothetical protein SFY80_09635 [Verrucomicrobiota bacterium]|nr:hypothetical protein [Verrucomicrobiota bacterium]